MSRFKIQMTRQMIIYHMRKMAAGKMKRPKVFEAWMNHAATPIITERLVDGRIRRVGRLQIFSETPAQEHARMLDIYGKRWTGIHG